MLRKIDRGSVTQCSTTYAVRDFIALSRIMSVRYSYIWEVLRSLEHGGNSKENFLTFSQAEVLPLIDWAASMLDNHISFEYSTGAFAHFQIGHGSETVERTLT